MKYIFIFLIYLTAFTHLFAQNNQQEKLKVFLDCSDTRCDQNYIRTEITVVNFSLDQSVADVHVLITSQRTGSGGREYQMIFFGQRKFSHLKDTITFSTSPNATDFERRDQILIHLKIGLIPFLIEKGTIGNIKVDMKSDELSGQTAPLHDPWNYWVFRIGAEGSMGADKNYRELNVEGDISANRTTDKSRLYFAGDYEKNMTTYEYESDGEIIDIKVENHEYRFGHGFILSINDHWSYGYETFLTRNTFSNIQNRFFFQPAIEYSIYPYKEVNNRFFTIRYGIDYWYNNYYDTTIYEKMEESLVGHTLEVNISYNQKWGTISSGIDYHNYFHDWSFYNIGLFARFDIRITGGLSIFTGFFGEIIHDQLHLPKGEATEQEVLTRRRELESSYSYRTYFGVNYRFGSIYNNFVNPRFR